MMPALFALVCLCLATTASRSSDAAAPWNDDPIWHDGLVEKATYTATRVVYGQPRSYEAVFFTNKEQHDVKTLTKAARSQDTVEVWKHNQVETIPTPNYPYHYVTTSHLTVQSMELTRLESSSQEFCGTSFKQYLRDGRNRSWKYWAFSYMPEAGRTEAVISESGRQKVMPRDALPLFLRDYPFGEKTELTLSLLPSQKSNRTTPEAVVAAVVRHAGQEGSQHRLELLVEGKLDATYWFDGDRGHVMTRYAAADGSQTYQLKQLERVDYWTIRGE
jgi:hypothetical protein